MTASQQTMTVYGVTGDQGLMTMCQCSTFLDPYPTGQTAQWRYVVNISRSQSYFRCDK